MNAREMAEVMMAYADGKEIEFRPPYVEKWRISHNPTWDWSVVEYRVKPEPLTMYCIVDEDGRVHSIMDRHVDMLATLKHWQEWHPEYTLRIATMIEKV
jgi:hypothetical protein